VVVGQGEVWWVDLAEPRGSEPGFRRPVVVIQGDALNRSRIGTILCVVLTGSVRWADAPGNVLLSAKATGLAKDSVANVSQIITLDRDAFLERMGKLVRAKLELISSGIDIVLDRRT
jgi:mRNA interferase MazF